MGAPGMLPRSTPSGGVARTGDGMLVRGISVKLAVPLSRGASDPSVVSDVTSAMEGPRPDMGTAGISARERAGTSADVGAAPPSFHPAGSIGRARSSPSPKPVPAPARDGIPAGAFGDGIDADGEPSVDSVDGFHAGGEAAPSDDSPEGLAAEVAGGMSTAKPDVGGSPTWVRAGTRGESMPFAEGMVPPGKEELDGILGAIGD
jgi:hypothetical protein